MTNENLMREAIRLSEENVSNGGGPFGAVIAKDGKIVATGANRVTADNDPTAHAEVNAIRAAAKKLGTFDLSGCIIFSSCEPCPMCLGAIYWAKIGRLFFGNNKTDADAIGFGDAFIYDELARPLNKRKLTAETLLADEAKKAFRMWADKDDKTPY
ncbi:MAG: nucleoside deaminase [Prevotella sp.]|nr:nucleoside deaminase [Prevotella sp.]